MYEHTHDPDRRGVTPVIGIVLLVAITVLLAATVGAMVFGMDDEAVQQSTPAVAVEFDYSGTAGADDVLEVQHVAGPSVEADGIELVVEDATCAGGAPNGRWSASALGATGELTAGDGVTLGDAGVVCPGGDLSLSGASVTVVWVTADSDTSTTLDTWNGPA